MSKRILTTPLRNLLLAAAVASLAGCGKSPEPLPQTQPVKGKVVYQGGAPVAGASVRFQSKSDITVTVSATTADDGTFALRTMREGLTADGAPEGQYRVTVTPPDTGDQMTVPTTFKEPYTVKPGGGEFTLTINRSGR